MTIMSTANATTDVLAELTQQNSTNVEMMIGVGLVKDSDAVFFQYVGEKDHQALMLPTGKPMTRIQNVKLVGISVADDIGEFKASKLNVFLSTAAGHTVMLTSGLTTIWSQCLITGLMGAYENECLPFALTIDSWKGNSKMKPCFAAVRSGDLKVSDADLYEQLKEARTDRDNDKVQKILRDSVSILAHAIGVESVVVETEVKQEADL